MNIFEFNIDIPNDSDSMGLPRAQMPQIHAKDYKEYVKYLKSNGVEFKKESSNARNLRPMQSEFSKEGVLKQLEKNLAAGGSNSKPIIASSDNYIIDGHHRWLAAKNIRGVLNVYRANVKGRVLLDLTLKFPKVYFKDIYNEGYKLQLERDREMLVLNITDTATGKRTEVRGKSGYETGNYDPTDKLHKLLDKVGKSANISDLMNGEVVGINPNHPDAKHAKAATDIAFNENLVNEDGRVVKGVNTTPDVGINQTKIEAKKLGNKVDKDGKPPLLHKKAYKNTTPNTSYNLGLSETYTPLEIAIIEGGHCLEDAKPQKKTPGKLFKSLVEISAFNESLDNPYPFKLTGPDDERWIATANTPNGVLRMEFDGGYDDYSIDFAVGKSMGKTDAGDQFRVFATVAAMLYKWIDAVGIKHVENFDFGADKSDHASDGRARLYTRFAKKLASQLGWKLQISAPGAGNTAFFSLVNPKPVPRPDDYFEGIEENFADGKVKGKSRPGRVKRAGASCDGSVTELRKKASNASGEKAKMYHWCANMKSGRK